MTMNDTLSFRMQQGLQKNSHSTPVFGQPGRVSLTHLHRRSKYCRCAAAARCTVCEHRPQHLLFVIGVFLNLFRDRLETTSSSKKGPKQATSFSPTGRSFPIPSMLA